MSEPQIRRFPFWLTLSVLGNLVLLGLIAGIFLNAPKKPEYYRAGGSDRPHAELSQEDRAAVRHLMRESFEAGREAFEARRAAERKLAEVLSADPYDPEASRVALASLRVADAAARDIVGDRMFEGLADLSSDQRALVARVMVGNLEKRGKKRERFEKYRERRDGLPLPEGDQP